MDKTGARRRAIIVLGMHRSGTSALAGTLARLGARLPARQIVATTHNAKGHFEPYRIVAIHNRLLASAGLHWADWQVLPRTWLTSPAASAFVRELAAAVREDYGNAPLFVVKDPRMCLLVPLWRRVLEDVGAEARFAIALRHPAEVAWSLQARDQIPTQQAYLTWLRHLIEAERSTRESKRLFVHFDELLANPVTIASDIAALLTDGTLALDRDRERSIVAFIDKGLRHHVVGSVRPEPQVASCPWVLEAYEALGRLVHDPTDGVAIGELDRISAAFDHATGLLASLTAEQKTHISSLMHQLETIKSSTSWRLLAPLRWYGRKRSGRNRASFR